MRSYFQVIVLLFFVVCVAACTSESGEQASDSANPKNINKKKPGKKKRQNKNQLKNQPEDITVATAQQEMQVADTYPLYPGCTEKEYNARKKCAQQKMIDGLMRVVKYPESAIRDKVNGVVVHSFVIEADGTMSNLKLTQSLNADCDAAAKQAIIDLMEVSGPWEPGTFKGKKMAVNYSLPINFQNK